MASRETRRVARERRTITAMIAMYCRDHHQRRGLCQECAGLASYADARLDHCPYGMAKPTCVTCPIHCYAPRMRESVREVMRFAGPRMLWRHPVLAIAHVVDGRRAAPELPELRRKGAPFADQAPPADERRGVRGRTSRP